MTNPYTYPQFRGGLGQSGNSFDHAPSRQHSDPTRTAETPLSHDLLRTFLGSFAISACLLAIFFGNRLSSNDQDIDYSLSVPPPEIVDALLASMESIKADSPRQQFLAGTLSEQAFQLRNQVRFLTGIIKAHLATHPEAANLAYLIVQESLKANYDPLFVAAVIRSESTFKRSARSNKGACGLMQLMPDTGQYVSKLQNVAWTGAKTLHDPSTNLRLGIAYLKYLEDMFNGNRERALVAYNWGPGNLELALKGRQRLPSQPVQYARKILMVHKQWKNALTQFASGMKTASTQRTLG